MLRLFSMSVISAVFVVSVVVPAVLLAEGQNGTQAGSQAGSQAGCQSGPQIVNTSFELYDLGDRLFNLRRTISDPSTKMVVVDFFSMACAPCKRAMPRLAELQRTYAGAGLRVVVVAIPAGGERSAELERVQGFFEPLANPFPVVFDKYSVVARQYGVTDGHDARLPQSFIVGSDGRVVSRFDDMNAVISAIEARFGAAAATAR